MNRLDHYFPFQILQDGICIRFTTRCDMKNDNTGLPTRNETDIVPDYYLHETEQWLKFPHSLEGLTPEEVREHRPALADILEKAKP